MLHLGVWTNYIAVAFFAYTAFVFLSESFNPFKSKKGPGRRRWRLARSLALTLFIVSTIALLVEPYIGLPRLQLILAVAMLCFVFSLYLIYKYHRLNNHSTQAQLAQDPTTTIPAPTALPEAALPNKALEAEPSPVISLSSSPTVALAAQDVAARNQMDTTSDTLDISVSEEHALELELSNLNRDADLDYLDQTIAEAEFISADLTLSETRNIAQPDLSESSLEGLIADDFENDSDIAPDLANESADRSDTPRHESLESNASDPNEALLQMLEEQNEKIQNLAKSNQSLVEIRESLVDEMTELKFTLKKNNAITRKSIAERDQAVKTKNSALTLAAMEIKKRKLTEIKARKALLKMQNSLKELTDQSVE